MSAVQTVSSGGRAAALARRRAMSQGKAALPRATERVRTGDRTAALPTPTVVAAPSSQALPSNSEPVTQASTSPSRAIAAPTQSFAQASQSGRALSMLRRQQLSGGKTTLNAARNASTHTSVTVPPGSRPPAAPTMAAATSTARFQGSGVNGVGSGHDQARARRALMSQQGRGDKPAALPSRPARQGKLDYAPKVTASTTHGGQIVTGSRIGRGSQVTGDEPGTHLPVSGTQYIGASDGPPVRSGGPKVGLARTAGGSIVSGTLVRSKVSVTGDERGGRIAITGEAEQNLDDDVTPRASDSAHVSSQFNRQVDPHGHSVFGTNLGRSANSLGSRVRTRELPIESTENGLPITGSAVGRGGRVTGDENGVCRQVTGNQYLTPASSQAECGGSGGGTAPAVQLGAARRDPVTGAKVSVAQTWGQQRLTGTHVEHNPRVSGDAAGSCSIITGTPYQGPATVHGWCDPATASTAEDRLPRRAATAAISGDVPRHSDSVTGTHRGAAREVTGSAYFRESADAPATGADEGLAGVNARFSIASPQRTAQLRARAAQASPDTAAASSPITGSFAIASGRVTGNAEFNFRPRGAADKEAPAARSKLTGEGREQGTRVSGWSWTEQSNVTGVDGSNAVERNPSERAGKAQAFSGARKFKTLAKREETKQLVTGLAGWSGKTAARVTLSGGAQA